MLPLGYESLNPGFGVYRLERYEPTGNTLFQMVTRSWSSGQNTCFFLVAYRFDSHPKSNTNAKPKTWRAPCAHNTFYHILYTGDGSY